ncbi:hypothetical protein NHQ30_006086 [Ciborinia camelliae]|nr:hypothetical protein NHQ30_006086 [Ciborinia camelliae]
MLLGAVFLTSLGFYFNLPFGLLAILAISAIHIPSIPNPVCASWSVKKKLLNLDPCGFILFTPTTVTFLLALEWGGSTYRWSSPTIIGLFCCSFVLLLLFLSWEYKEGENAMIPLHMLTKRIVYSGCLTSLFNQGGLMLLSYYLPVWFQTVKGVSPTGSGPVTAIQNSLPPSQIPIGSSLATFSNYFGGAIFLSFASTIFTNSLREKLKIYAPDVDVEMVIASGATGLRDLVKGLELDGVLRAYNQSLVRCFYLAAGGASAAFFCSFGLGWGTVKTKNKKLDEDHEKAEENLGGSKSADEVNNSEPVVTKNKKLDEDHEKAEENLGGSKSADEVNNSEPVVTKEQA